MDGGNFTPRQGLDALTTPEQLAVILGTSYGKIKHFYYGRNGNRISSFYNRFEINKKGGGTREIFSPQKQLKVLQGRLAFVLAELYKPRSCAKAFIRGRSLYDNASSHTRKSFVFNVDLKDFFTSISFARVRGLLIAQPYKLNPATASVIAHMCTVNGFLPQGAPTSPILSNMICSSLDRQLSVLAKTHRAAYTRYADDITFSFYCPAKHLPKEIVVLQRNIDQLNHYGSEVGRELQEIVSANGFTVNVKKVRLQSKHERQVVTGLTVNKIVNVDRRYIRKTSAMIHCIERLGIDEAREINKAKNPSKEDTGEASFELEPHIQGRLLFIKQIKGDSSQVYRNLAIRFNALSVEYKVPLSSTVPNGSEPTINRFVDKCWVLEGEDIISQGTGFMLDNGLMATCAHVVAAEPNSDKHAEWFWAFRVNNKAEKFKALIVHYDKHRDLALLKLDGEAKHYPFFRIEEKVQIKQQDKVSIYGFPDYKPASTSVGCVWARIVNSFVLSCVKYYEVDKVLYSGNSGGPVLNANHHVVGVAARGAVEGKELNAFICSSELNLVLNKYLHPQE
ncbi:trypsin-like peptidase domain-containing protein [Stutzerimonas frequens]|uniref:trypsin-like peptidase domain-containing protein n=1 Tax=Stutzerimonas frequens TaxID=2968969 RepID=UPI002555F042|nr:trypsin-like peptidase domain-containing protein [Stutzerimonas frequens]MDL0441898.1 trypsin-like peptidase domain-containing protein [Stutzerimonas frequens]